MYNPNNIFAKIISGEIPCKKIKDGKHYIAFHDANAKAKVHILVIPKKSYENYHDFIKNATNEEIIDFNKGVCEIIKEFNLEEFGYRLISNTGSDGGQEVYHYHLHVLGGQELGLMINCATKISM